MSMQTPDISFGHESEGDSGTFERGSASGPASSAAPVSLGPVSINTLSKFEEAHRLACAIEELLTPADAKALATEGYGPRLARALARSLIDQLADLNRSRVA
jgi:hypothetical protein